MNDPHDDASSGADDTGAAPDIDPRFDPAAAGGAPADGDAPTARSAQEQIDEMAAACNEWVRAKPLQALAVAAGLGFLLGRVGR